MKSIVCTAAVLALLAASQVAAQPPTNQLLLDLQSFYTKQELDEGVYIGSEFCLACHPTIDIWRDTRHARDLRRPDARYSLQPGRGVVADYDGNGVDDFRQGLDFNRINSPFNRYKPNAPKLSFEGGGYFITLGGLKMPVVATQGGNGEWRQLYLVRVPVASGGRGGLSVDLYVSPVQYNEGPDAYEAYEPRSWWDANNRPLFGGGVAASQLAQRSSKSSYSKECVGCHVTGVRSLRQTGAGEWDFGAFVAVLFDPDDPAYFDYDGDEVTDLVNVGCETCHGPGSKHVLAGGDPDFIVNPNDLNTSRANEVCGQCHLRVQSVPNRLHGWPYDDANGRMWRPNLGEPLARFFRDAAVRWPDDINSRLNHQQYFDFLASQKPDFPFHPVQCAECHDPHGGTVNPYQLRDVLVEGGVAIRSQPENNTLCLACHAGFGDFAEISKQDVASYEANLDKIAGVVSEHTNHPYGPTRRMGLSRCTLCHMPKVAESAVPYDIASHSFEAIPPEKNLAYQAQGGMPDSCNVSCHGVRVNVFDLGIDSDVATWNQSFDKRAARRLLQFFGPGGVWWNTSDPDGLTFQHLEAAAAPGEVAPPDDASDD